MSKSKDTAGSSSSSSVAAAPTDGAALEQLGDEQELLMQLYGGESGWVEPRTACGHLESLSSDLTHIPTPDSFCFRCYHPDENWLCLACKDVLCSRFVNKHMLEHYQQQNHCLGLSYSDLSVWCFNCDAYLDAQVIAPLRPVYETAYLLKFGELPPSRSVLCMELGESQTGSSSCNGDNTAGRSAA